MIVLSLSLLACTREVAKDSPLCDAPGTWYVDADGDGWGGEGADLAPVEACFAPAGYAARTGDCDDADPATHPGQLEPDCGAQVDANCDGSIGLADGDGDGLGGCDDCDDADPAIGAPRDWHLDADGDGFGGDRLYVNECAAPAGYVAASGDCDDLDARAYPGAPEACDGIDNDCSGGVDEGVGGGSTWYRDGDGDGYGTTTDTLEACGAPVGYVARAEDCDDADARVRPGAAETCDGVDQDCDGSVDDDATGATSWYADLDGDGVGDSASRVWSCDPVAGHVADDGDCDDADPGVSPDALELCDGIDQNCDGDIDEDAADAATWYADLDGDGAAGDRWTEIGCEAPAGYLAEASDCDDLDDARYPGADETCDGVDQDCDGTTDEDATDETAWFADTDGDGFGDPGATLPACDMPAGYVATGDDCDDGDPRIAPRAVELCDGIDQDCDGTTDEDAVDEATWYADVDGDGAAGSRWTATACEAPAGYLATASDCDDLNDARHPGAEEICDGVDQDCDGSVDEDATDETVWYADADGDGAGDPDAATLGCEAPLGHAATADDCDDADPSVAPDAFEFCDGVDQDCDGDVDEDALDRGAWYADADGDGTGDPATLTRNCDAPAGHVGSAGDCDDTSGDRRPGGAEVCDGLDNDCDGTVDDNAIDRATWYLDGDADGVGIATGTTRACDLPDGYAATAGDCDDTDGAISPGADETCDGVDQDCDGDTDEDATDAVVYYYDIDGDGFGNARFPLAACDVPDGYVANADDCDDTDGYAYPGATERCDDADNDCDGSVDEDLYVMQYADEDGDGFGDPALPEYACLGTYGLVSDATDCDDSDADVNTDATEVCDAIDNDCDGATDEGWLVRRYLDEDGDGYGDAATGMDVCPDEPDVVATAGDCDDADATVSPAATETCDGVDEDCDGGTDEGLLGSGAACAAEDCLDVLTDRPSATNGSYWLYGSGSVVSAVCDMTGGGWTRVLADTMDSPDSGWSTRTTTNCGGTTMLGGYNVFGAGASVSNTVATAYTHTQVKVTLDYWFIDSWDGESGTLDLAGTRVWTQSRIMPSGTQRCGRADSGWNEDTASVNQTVSHTASSIVVRASSTLNQTPDDESWGIDNVIVWVR